MPGAVGDDWDREQVGEGNVSEFELVDQAGQLWRLADTLQRGAVVLVFYRGDW